MFGKRIGLWMVAAGLLVTQAALAQKYQATWDSIDSRATPEWFTDAKFGIFIHFGVYSVPAYAPVGIPKENPYAEWYWNATELGKKGTDKNITHAWEYHKRVYGADYPYSSFAPQFKAQLFDPAKWADLFQRSGAKYVVLTSKHHDGFALWPSKEASRDYARAWNSVEIGPHRDIVGDLSEAVRAKGLKFGLYYSLYEWFNPLWVTDKPAFVDKHLFPQFKDLVTRYKPSLIWSDGEWNATSAEWRSPELLAWLFNDSPVKDEVAIDDRWGSDSKHKHGGYWTTEYTSGMAPGTKHPWEESRGIAYSYGYNRAESLADYQSSRKLVLMLVDFVSRGGNFLLDIGPNADGTIPIVMEERLTEMGSWLKINGDAIYGTHTVATTRQMSAGTPPKTDYNEAFRAAYDVTTFTDRQAPGQAVIEAFFTAKGDDLYAIMPHWKEGNFSLKLPKGTRVKSVALLGSDEAVTFKATAMGIDVVLPELPEDLRAQPAWTLKIQP
jgi:alpha-L-fucosidase